MPRSRNLVVCSDGTGNRAGKANGTNVWRMYEAIDRLASDSEPIQLATHDDGVGTSGNKVLKVLGGAFGFGLSANVRELYVWLSTTWRPGDGIYMFGFSRGAFTVRCLAAMIARCGLIDVEDLPEKKINDLAMKAWRIYKDGQGKSASAAALAFKEAHSVRVPVDPDGQGRDEQRAVTYDVPIRFLGVWDTVDAYGMPVDEMTDTWARISTWIGGLPFLQRVMITRFRDRKLSKLVQHACHAIALHDERHTFHPVLWDQGDAHDRERIEQVWFSGMHSDVGGGYTRRSLSLEPLYWMMQRAEANGLRLIPNHVQAARQERSAEGPMHDSRAGAAVLYRYRPRDVAELCREHHAPVRVHASVLERIAVTQGLDAPKGLPAEFDVEGSSPQGTDHRPLGRYLGMQRGVDFWRQCLYLILLALVMVLAWRALLPPVRPLPRWWGLADVVDWAGPAVPDVLAAPLHSLMGQPLVLWGVLAIGLLLHRLHSKLKELGDGMRREAWGFAANHRAAPGWMRVGSALSTATTKIVTAVPFVYGLLATVVIAAILALVAWGLIDRPERSPYPTPVELREGTRKFVLPASDREGRTDVVLLAGRSYRFSVKTSGTVPAATWKKLSYSIGDPDVADGVVVDGKPVAVKESGRLHLFLDLGPSYWSVDPWCRHAGLAGSATVTIEAVK